MVSTEDSDASWFYFVLFFVCVFFSFFFFCSGEFCCRFCSRLSLGCGGGFFGCFFFSSLCWFLGNEAFSSRPAFLTEKKRRRWWRPHSEASLTRSSSLGPLSRTWSSSTSGSLQACRPLDRFHWLLESVSRRLWPGCSAPSASSPTQRIVLQRPQRAHLISPLNRLHIQLQSFTSQKMLIAAFTCLWNKSLHSKFSVCATNLVVHIPKQMCLVKNWRKEQEMLRALTFYPDWEKKNSDYRLLRWGLSLQIYVLDHKPELRLRKYVKYHLNCWKYLFLSTFIQQLVQNPKRFDFQGYQEKTAGCLRRSWKQIMFVSLETKQPNISLLGFLIN